MIATTLIAVSVVGGLALMMWRRTPESGKRRCADDGGVTDAGWFGGSDGGSDGGSGGDCGGGDGGGGCD